MPLPISPPLSPQLARSRTSLPEGEGWAYEPKFDGFRALVFVDGDEKVIASRNGIAADLLYMGKPGEAAAELQALNDKARSDGDRRTALFAMTVVEADGGTVIGVRDLVHLSLSYDHRLVDGADAARYLVAVRRLLEAAPFADDLLPLGDR